METEKSTYEISFLARTEEGAGTVLRYLSQVGADVTGEQQIEQINRRDPEDPVVGLTIQLTVTRVRPMIDKGDEL